MNFSIIPSEYTILIVDDNPTNLGVVTDHLAAYGFDLLTALDGEDGLATAEMAHPHLILLDIMMPGIDGFEVCRRLKARDDTRDIPIIFMSALAGVEDKVRGFEAGAVDYVTKPIQQEELLARVTTHLRLQSLTRDLQGSLSETGELLAAAQAIMGATDLKEICQHLLHHFTRLVHADRTSLFLVNHEERRVELKMGAGGVSEIDLDIPYAELEQGISGLVFRAAASGGIKLQTRDGEWLLAPGQPVLSLSPDDGIEPAETRDRRQRAGVGALIVVPLVARGRVIGSVTTMNRADQRKFNQHDVDLLATLVTQAAVAIDNVRLFAQSQRDKEALDASYRREQGRRQLSDTLREVSKIVTSTLDEEQVLDLILTQLDHVITYHRATVTLLENDELHVVAGRDKTGRPITHRSIPVDQYPLNAEVIHNGQPMLIPVTQVDERWQATDGFAQQGSFINAPLLAQDHPIGLLGVLRCDDTAYTEEDAEIVFAFASQVAIALDNARLYDEVQDFSEQLEQLVWKRTDELKQAYHKLERLDRSKSDFIAVIAHELRTPLTVLSGYTQVLGALPAVKQDPDVQNALEGIMTGQNRMQEIVNSILDVTRVDIQTLKLYKKRTFIEMILRAVGREFQPALQERNLTMNFEGVEGLPAIMVDPDLVHKVFYHLVVNAIKYTADGGSILVKGRRLDLNGNGGPQIEICVVDTGIGIDPAHHELIFEKFYQTGEVSVHSSGRTKFKGGGPGVGLAIAKGIVEAHRGRIWVESAGHDEVACPGSAFHVVLPALDEK